MNRTLVALIYAFLINPATAQPGLIPLSPASGFDEKDFETILTRVPGSKIIALSEADHGKNEPLNFRNMLIKVLVEQKLIDVVALESGTIEGKLLYDYVLGKGNKDDINQVLKQGFSWHFYVIPQNEELVTWLRGYNSNKSNTHKVKLYGFDIPGSPGNPSVNRKMDTAVEYTLAYVQSVDTAAHAYYKKGFEWFLPYLNVYLDDPLSEQKQFSHLGESDRLKLSQLCNELVKHLETRKVQYSKSLSKEEFDWAYLSALNAQQIFNWLNNIPVGYVPPLENKILVNSDVFHSLFNYRDRAMYDNLNWIIKREAGSRIFTFASTNHLLKTPIILTDETLKVQQRQGVGNYLQHKYGDAYLLIANIVANGALKEMGIENKFADGGADHYYMSLNTFKTTPETDWQKLYYQTIEFQTNLVKGADFLLFDKQQTDIKFRE